MALPYIIYCYCSFFRLLSQTSHGNRQNDIVVAQSFIDCLTKWAWPKHMQGNAPMQPHRMKFQQKARENIFHVFNFHNIRIFDWEQLKNKALPKGTVILNGKLYHYNYIFFWGTVLLQKMYWILFIPEMWSSDPEMIYRSQSSTWFMLGSGDGNMIFFSWLLHTPSWGYVLYL